MVKATSVDEYIKGAPKVSQPKLKELRAAIKEAAPEALEKISYGMPYYYYKGKVAYFGYFKNHVSFFAIPPATEIHKEELKKYKTSKGTIQFPLNDNLPINLIKKLVKERIEINKSSK